MKFKWGRMDGVILLIALIPIVFAWSAYDRLPDTIVTHWNFKNQPDGFMSKNTGLLIPALLLLGIPFLMKVFRRLDPRRENYEMFAATYEIIRLAVTVLLASVMMLLVLANLGYDVDSSRVVPVLVGGIFLVLGNYMGRIRFNYFIGIRTPWTLASEEVWRRTHRFAGPIWFFGGLLAILCAFLPAEIPAFVSLGVIVATALIPTVYSYLAYSKEQKRR